MRPPSVSSGSSGRIVTRWFAGAALVGGVVGALVGLVEAIALYPLSAWAAVTLWVGVLAATASAVLGVLGAGVVVLVRNRR